MSSKNNVNKDFYTLAGRDRPNEVIDAAARRLADETPHHPGDARPDFIPGARSQPAPRKRAAKSGKPRRRAA